MMISGPRDLRPRHLNISQATRTSSTGSRVRDTLKVSPIPFSQQKADSHGTFNRT